MQRSATDGWWVVRTSSRIVGGRRSVALVLGLWIGLLLATAAGAQEVDPPDRVGRLAEIRGQVWLNSQGSGEWVGAVRNQPLARGDRLAADPGARATVEVGSTTVRLDGATEIEVLQLDDQSLVLGLEAGSVAARVRDPGAAGQVAIATEEGRFVVLRPGTVRVDRQDTRSDLTVYAGAARYEGTSSAIVIEPGQHAQFFIDGAGTAQYSLLAPVNDAFAGWVDGRDVRTSVALAERYVSPEMTGVADLDAYGRWEQDPEYGALWIPTTVAADWAPYTAGHWSYVQPWGWSWVDDAPWGFAPFHYGRWTYARSRWCWVPGQRVARPVYAPALVAWVGTPIGRSTFAGGPPVGWVPLAPREVYVPPYRVSLGYVRQLNGGHVGDYDRIDRVYERPQAPRDFANRGAPRGLTMVPPEVLTGRRPVAPGAAESRRQPWWRDVAGRPGNLTPVLAPPVGAPVARGDGRTERGPPGWTGGGRGGDVRSTLPAIGGGDARGGVRPPMGFAGGAERRFERGPDERRDERGDPGGRADRSGERGDGRDRGFDDRRGGDSRGVIGTSPSLTPPGAIRSQPAIDPRAAVGQPPLDGRVGQPPFDSRVGQPLYGRPSGAGMAPNPAPGRGLPAIGVTAPGPNVSNNGSPPSANGPAVPNGAGMPNGAPTMQAFPIRRGEDRRGDDDRIGGRRTEDVRSGERRFGGEQGRGDGRAGFPQPGGVALPEMRPPAAPERAPMAPTTPMVRMPTPAPAMPPMERAAPIAPVQRPAEAAPPPRATELPRPGAAPAPAPQMQQRSEPRVGWEEGPRRGDQQR